MSDDLVSLSVPAPRVVAEKRESHEQVQRRMREWERAQRQNPAYCRLLAYGSGVLAHLEGKENKPPERWPENHKALFREGWSTRNIFYRPGETRAVI